MTYGIYVTQLRRLHEHFPRNQVFVIRSEDLFENVQPIYDKLLDFLELPSHQVGEPTARNALTYRKRDDTSGTRAQIMEFFAPFNLELYEYLGRDLRWE